MPFVRTGGQVIGATDRLGPWDLIATVCRHLGIEAASVSVPDATGRPVSILPEGEPNRELTANR
jgi:hypothetical protein